LTPGPGREASFRDTASTPSAASSAKVRAHYRQADDEVEADAPAPPKRPPPLRQQIEAYFSNDSLRTNRPLYDLIRDSSDGWIDLEEVLGLKQLRSLHVKRDDVLRALRGSWLETWSDGLSAALRRPPDRPLPTFGGPAAAPGRRPAPPEADPFSADAGDQRRSQDAACREEGVVATDVLKTGPMQWQADQELKRQRAASGAAGPAAKRPREEASGSRFTGVVSTFNLRLGLGKIKCHQTGRDVVINVAELAGFDVGDAVSFLITKDPVLGTPRAQKLKHLGAEEADEEAGAKGPEAEAEAAEGAEEGEEEAAAAGEVEEEVAAPESPHTPPQEESDDEETKRKKLRSAINELPPDYEMGTRLSGVIKGLNKRLGLGGVKCTETGRLVKVPMSELAGFEVGDIVSFALNSSGQALGIEAA